MNFTDFEASLPFLFEAQVTPFVWGHAGLGKTTGVKNYAASKGYKFFPLYLGTQADVGDVLGLADFVKDSSGKSIATDFAMPGWLRDMIDYCEQNPESGGIIFLDELNRARKDILQGVFSLALDKRFHTIQLPKNCYLIAAGNPPTDEYSVTDVDDSALMARFVHIKLEPTFEEWINFAKTTGVEPTLISFLQEQPDLLEEKRSHFELPIKVDRRAFSRVSSLFDVNTPINLLTQLMHGIIGVERTVAYQLHLAKAEKPLSGEEVLAGKSVGIMNSWKTEGDVKSSLFNLTADNVYDTLKTMAEKGLTITPAQEENLVVFFETCTKDSAFPIMRKLFKESNKIFYPMIEDDSVYNKRLSAVLASCKGIADATV